MDLEIKEIDLEEELNNMDQDLSKSHGHWSLNSECIITLNLFLNEWGYIWMMKETV